MDMKLYSEKTAKRIFNLLAKDRNAGNEEPYACCRDWMFMILDWLFDICVFPASDILLVFFG